MLAKSSDADRATRYPEKMTRQLSQADTTVERRRYIDKPEDEAYSVPPQVVGREQLPLCRIRTGIDHGVLTLCET